MSRRSALPYAERLRDERCQPERLLREAIQPLIERALVGRVRVRIPSATPRLRPEAGKHVHMLPELFIQLEGACEFRFPGEEVILRAGEVLLVPSGVAHGERTVGRSEAFCNFVLMLFGGRVGGHFAVSRNGRPSVCRPCPGVRQLPFTLMADLVETLPAAVRQGGVVGAALSRSAVLGILGRLASLPESEGGAKGDSKISQCRQLIRSQLASREMNVNHLAEWLGCTPSYLSHRFRQETGSTLTAFIARLRVEYAEELLATTTHTVQEIAWACGFSSHAYFSRTYRRLRGFSPRDFRAKTPSDIAPPRVRA